MGLILGVAACSGGGDDASTEPPGIVPPTPSSPPSSGSNSAPVIETSAISGLANIALSTSIAASDADGDAISFSLIESPDWLSVNASGATSGTPSASDIGASTIVVEASDGTDATRAEIRLNVTSDPVEQALRTGDYTIIAAESDLTPAGALLEEFERIRAQNNADIATLFQLSANGSARTDSLTEVTWELSNQAALLSPEFGGTAPFLVSNASRDPANAENAETLGVFGRTDNSRFIALGDNPMRAADLDPSVINQDMQQLMQNMVAWLLGSDPNSGFNVVLANLPDRASFPDESTTRSWLTATFGDAVSLNSEGDCDGLDLQTCLTDETDMIVISQDIRDAETASAVRAQVEQAMADGVAVFYLHAFQNRQALGTELFEMFNVGYLSNNTRPQAFASEASPIGVLQDWQPDELAQIENLIDNIERENLDFDLTACQQYWECTENASFTNEVAVPLLVSRLLTSTFDTNKTRPFPATRANRLSGLLLLTGDDYRNQTEFPMRKGETPSTDIIRAMFGDLTAIIHRDSNPIAALGPYSREQFRSDLLGNETLNLESQHSFRTTGLYAVPGETVTVTRTDSSDVDVRLRVQSVREHASAPFRAEYNRPLILSSNRLLIEPGETLQFTSAFGGPVHAHFSADGQEVELDFQNVGKHPVWRGPADTQAFLNALTLDAFDWAEFVTPYFEIHSSAEKMRETLDENHISGPSDLADLTDEYVRDWPHWLAGWEGPGISNNPDLRDFANRNGLTIRTTSIVKHMNADRPACTQSSPHCSGTSGNPYDALWSYDPLNVGDLHELGHGLEFRARHHFEGGDATHSTTNLYAFHTQYRYFSDTGVAAFRCPGLPHGDLFETIQDSRSRSDPAQYMLDQDLSTQNQQITMFVQLLAALENQGAFDDGWAMMPRLNLVTREFQSSDNDTLWAAKAAGLGFEGFDRDAAFSLSQNDWLLIALSWSEQRDLRSYLEMWGYTYSEMALNHVASLGLPSLSPAYYAIGTDQHCRGLDHPELPIDGVTSWSSKALANKPSAFTSDYLRFDHGGTCTLEAHTNSSIPPLSVGLQGKLERFREHAR